MNLQEEPRIPLILAILVAVGGFALMNVYEWKFNAERPQFLLATVTFGAIMAGFTATNFSLIVLPKSDLMKRMRQTHYYHSLIDYLRRALYLATWLACFGLVALFCADWIPSTGIFAHVFGTFWLWLTSWTVFHFLLVVKISVEAFKQI